MQTNRFAIFSILVGALWTLTPACGPQESVLGELSESIKDDKDGKFDLSKGKEIAPNVIRHGPFKTDDGEQIIITEFIDFLPSATDGEDHTQPTEQIKGKPQGNEPEGANCYTLMNHKWRGKSVDWMINNWVEPLSHDTVKDSIQQAMGVWEDAANNRKIFGNYDESGTSSNTIQFAEMSYPVLGAAMIYSRLRVDRYEPYRYKVYFNSQVSWTTDGTSGVDFISVAAHELGHVAGLGHSPNDCTEETMYYAYRGISDRDLHTGDIAGIREKY